MPLTPDEVSQILGEPSPFTGESRPDAQFGEVDQSLLDQIKGGGQENYTKPAEQSTVELRPGTLANGMVPATTREYTPSGALRSMTLGAFTPSQQREIDKLKNTYEKFSADSDFTEGEKAVAKAEIRHRLSQISPVGTGMEGPKSKIAHQFEESTYTDPKTNQTWLYDGKKWENISTDHEKPITVGDYQKVWDAVHKTMTVKDPETGEMTFPDVEEVNKITAAQLKGFKILNAEFQAATQHLQSQPQSPTTAPQAPQQSAAEMGMILAKSMKCRELLILKSRRHNRS